MGTRQRLGRTSRANTRRMSQRAIHRLPANMAAHGCVTSFARITVITGRNYAFSRTRLQSGRGHYYAIDDIRKTLRTACPNRQPAGPARARTCPADEQDGTGEVLQGHVGGTRSGGCQPHRLSRLPDPKHESADYTARSPRRSTTRGRISKGRHTPGNAFARLCTVPCQYYFKGKEDKCQSIPMGQRVQADSMEAYYDDYRACGLRPCALSRTPILKRSTPIMNSTGRRNPRPARCRLLPIATCHTGVRGREIHQPLDEVPSRYIAGSCQRFFCHRESEKTTKNGPIRL